MLYLALMTPHQLAKYLDKAGIHRKDFADRLGVTEAAISFWLRQGWMTYERQCSVQLELPASGLRASWNDVPKIRRPGAKPNGHRQSRPA